MFVGDQNHNAFMNAIAGLKHASKTLSDVDWLINLSKMMILATSTNNVDSIAELFVLNDTRIQQLQTDVNAGKEQIREADSTIELARTLVPNTTPPDPGGYESCSV